MECSYASYLGLERFYSTSFDYYFSVDATKASLAAGSRLGSTISGS